MTRRFPQPVPFPRRGLSGTTLDRRAVSEINRDDVGERRDSRNPSTLSAVRVCVPFGLRGILEPSNRLAFGLQKRCAEAVDLRQAPSDLSVHL